MRNAIVAASCAAACLMVAAPAHAQDQPFDQRTFYTFNNPVELPGVALPPGQYIFRLADPSSGRTMLQVLSADGKRVYGMFFSIPIEADRPADKPTVRFMEAAPGAPQAIRAVWYVNERTGREFIYPRNQAMRLAKSTKEPILTTAAATTKAEETNTPELARVDASGQNVAPNSSANDRRDTPSTTASSQTPSTTQTTSQAANMGQSTRTAGGGTASATPNRTTATRSALPQTGSTAPALVLMGMAILGAAAGLRFFGSTDSGRPSSSLRRTH